MMIGSVDNSSRHNSYVVKTENRQTLNAVDRAEEASKAEASNEPHDEYISGGGKNGETPGIYRLEKDENGQQKIVFDRRDSTGKGEQPDTAENLPEAASYQTNEAKSPGKKEDPEKSSDKKGVKGCTVSTDNVDAEIKRLKEKKQQIEEQLKNARDDEDKRKELEKQLSQVESELSAKDNDTYRKQHATYTYT